MYDFQHCFICRRLNSTGRWMLDSYSPPPDRVTDNTHIQKIISQIETDRYRTKGGRQTLTGWQKKCEIRPDD